MAIIKPKKRVIIQKGEGYTYNPATFAKEHKVANFYEIDDPQEVLDRLHPLDFMGRKFISFDTETHPHFRHSHEVPQTVVRRWVGTGRKAVPQDYPFCLSVCDGTNAFSIYDTVANNFDKFKQLAPIFEDPGIDKIAHNLKFDAHMFANANMRIVGRLHDTVVLTKIANENRKSFRLRDIAAEKKGGIIKFEYMVDTYKQMNKVSDYRHIPRELLSEYANADVWNCMITFLDEYPKLEAENLVKLYDTECEVMVVLYAMERYGMMTDPAYEDALKGELQTITDEAERSIYEEAGSLFNINSGKQLYEVLLGLGVNKDWIALTDKGNPKLDKNALNMLADRHNVTIVQKILEYRKYEKLLNTYAVGIYDQKDSAGRVHGGINQTEATTGRMSITKPALQTLPKRDKSIRKIFIPEDDYSLYFMDLDQVEYRMFAHYAKIPSLIEAIEKGHDVHAATAAMIYNVDIDELLEKINQGDSVASEMRGRGKTINFALIYGVGIEHLATLLKCTATEATNLRVTYFSQLPEAKHFIATVHQVISDRGFVKNFYGRRRRLSSNDGYKAPNALIQGCAADYLKDRLVQMYKYIAYNNLKSRLLLPVHDETIAMVHKDEEEHVPVLRWLLSNFTSFRCPITAGVEKGDPSWGQKITPDNVGFEEPKDTSFLSYNLYNGKVFDIYKEVGNSDNT